MPQGGDDYLLSDHPLFGRPQLALANILGMEPGAAGRSLWDPASVPPEKRKKLAQRFGLEGPLASLVNITTHPLVLLGLALTLTHKLPKLTELMPLVRGKEGLVHRWKVLEWIAPQHELFRGTPVPAILEAANLRFRGEYNNRIQQLVGALERYKVKTGTELALKDQVHLTGWMDRVHESSNPVWRVLKGRLKKDLSTLQAGRATQFGLSADELTAAIRSLEAPAPGLTVSTPLRELATDLSTYQRAAFQQVNHPKTLEVLARRLGTKAPTKGDVRTLARELEHYWPHTKVYTEEERLNMVSGLVREMQVKDLRAAGVSLKRAREMQLLSSEQQAIWQEQQAVRATRDLTEQAHQRRLEGTALRPGVEEPTAAATRVATTRAAVRRHNMLPNVEDLKVLGTPESLLRAIQAVQKAEGTAGYSLQLEPVLHNYFKDTARTWAWTVPPTGAKGARGYGEELVREVATWAGKSPADTAKAKMVLDVFQPMAMGAMTSNQAASALNWSAFRGKLIERLEKGVVGRHLGKVAPDLKKRLQGFLAADPMASYPGAGQAVSGFFYDAALGGNIRSTGQNMFQPWLTLAPMIGWGPTLKGFGRAGKGLLDYAALRFGNKAALTKYGMKNRATAGEALEAVFPEFTQMHLELEPLYATRFGELVEQSYQRLVKTPGGVKRALAVAREGLMLPFSHSELLNRLVAFYGTRGQALKELPGMEVYRVATKTWEKVVKGTALHQEAASEVGAHMVGLTQFGSGHLQKPSGTVQWWAPWSQFTTFPTRMASFMAGPAMRHKSILGRVLLGSGLIYGAGKEALGTDLSDALVWGGMPVPKDRGPFAPVPLVSPTLQLIGAAGMTAATGESSHLRESLPLLAPAGIAAARGVSALGGLPGVGGPARATAQFIGRPWADYRNRTPDGRIPVYSKTGSLVGLFTPAQIYSRAMGISGSFQAEQAVTKYLLGQRETIRRIKRDTMQALWEGDAEHVLSLSERYQEVVPRAGGLPLKRSDIRSLHMRRDVSRIERILETLPSGLRQEYLAMIATSLGPHYPGILGLIGPGLGNRTILERDVDRMIPLGSTAGRVSKGLHGVSLREKIRGRADDRTRAAHQRRRYGYTGFGSFEDF